MLNPDKNYFSVAPVGQLVIIGRQAALKGGMTRDNALNLLTWLILSTSATPDEISARIKDASVPTVRVPPVPAQSSGGPISRFAHVPQTAQPLPQPSPQSPVIPIDKNVTQFIGDVDPEEQAALDDVKAACEAAVKINPLDAGTLKAGPVDANAVAATWGVR